MEKIKQMITDEIKELEQVQNRINQFLINAPKGTLKIQTYPDFTVLNTHTGKITYWEHAGLMDDPKYGADFVWKYNLYQANNIIPGKDVIFTCESQLNPLDIGLVKKMIERLVGDV